MHDGTRDIERLSSSVLDPEEALRIAREGDPAQRGALATNQNIDRAAMEALVVDPDRTVAEGLLHNYELPRDVLSVLRERFLDDSNLCAMADGHPNAPTAAKLQASMDSLTWLAIDRFLDEVAATESERSQLDRISLSRPRTTLGEAWASIRPQAV